MTEQLHSWDLSPQEAIAVQKRLKGRVIRSDQLTHVKRVAGIDVGFEDNGQTVRAAIAVMSYPDLIIESRALARAPLCFPYIPGLLSFRELPGILQAWEQLPRQPDLVLCDGQGLAHPRRFGIACHLGVWLDCPTIGVAKSRLIGKHDTVPEIRGQWCQLTDKGEQIGAVLRTREQVKPVYVSIGHRVSLSRAIELVISCAPRYRLPEPIRAADKLASNRSPG